MTRPFLVRCFVADCPALSPLWHDGPGPGWSWTRIDYIDRELYDTPGASLEPTETRVFYACPAHERTLTAAVQQANERRRPS